MRTWFQGDNEQCREAIPQTFTNVTCPVLADLGGEMPFPNRAAGAPALLLQTGTMRRSILL
jgi:hypothetical protein